MVTGLDHWPQTLAEVDLLLSQPTITLLGLAFPLLYLQAICPHPSL